jgi:hypothetical protein
MSSGKFPKPYVNDTKMDPMMEYVPFSKTGIGSRASGLPKDGKKGQMGIEHVGGTAGGSK